MTDRSTGRSMQVAATTDRRLRAVLGHAQRAGRLPSIVAGLLRDGELVWSAAHGDTTGGQAPGPDLQYRIGSITKTMTMVLVQQCRREGLLALTDTVGHHLGEVGYAGLTLGELLSHSGGMQSEPAGAWWERSPGVSFARLAEANDGSGATNERGATYHYSNLGFGLLGEIVARLRGQTWWECVETRILAPLAMPRTSYLPQSPSAVGYSVHHFAGTLTEEPATDTGAMAPAGQVWSTVADLARFARFLLEGHPEVLPFETLQEAGVVRAASLAGGAAGGYGLALRVIPGGSGTLVGHTGGMPGFTATCFVDRARRTAAFCLANATTGMSPEPLARTLLETLEEAEPTVPVPWRPHVDVPGHVTEVLGVWHWGNTAYSFAWDGRQVVVTHLQSGAQAYRFDPIEGGLVGASGYHDGESLLVARDPAGTVTHLECATFVYTRVPYDPAAPIPGGHPD